MSSSAKKDGGPNKVGNLTPRDLEILSKAWGAMKTQPEMDYEKLAEACGMTNPRSAANAWSAIKKKLFTEMPAGSPGGEGAGKASETPGKKRKARATKEAPTAKDSLVQAEADDDDFDAEATPTKKRGRAKPKPKGNPANPAGVKKEEESSEEKEAKPVKVNAAKGAKAKPKKEAKREGDSDGPEGADLIAPFEPADGEV